MEQSQSFTIQPSGVVRGGSASYTVDLDNGALQYSAEVKCIWPVGTKDDSGPYQVDPKDLLSSVFQKSGDQMVVGPVTFTAIAILPHQANVSITISGSNITGEAQLDTTNQYVKLLGIQAQGSYGVVSFNLNLVPNS